MSKPLPTAATPAPSPATKNRTVTSPRQGKRNQALRSREYLTPAEVASLVKAARHNRWGQRDSTLLLVAYQHGLRASELCALRWEQVDLEAACLHVRRVKKGRPATHPLPGNELRALRRLKREAPPSPYVFVSERGSPMTPAAFAKMLSRLEASIGFPLKLHPHMLRHSCGYKLANDGQDTAPSRHTWAIAIFSIRSGIPSCHHTASKGSLGSRQPTGAGSGAGPLRPGGWTGGSTAA